MRWYDPEDYDDYMDDRFRQYAEDEARAAFEESMNEEKDREIEKEKDNLAKGYEDPELLERVARYFAAEYPPNLDAGKKAAQEVEETLGSAEFKAEAFGNEYGIGVEVTVNAYEPWFSESPAPARVVVVRRRCQKCHQRVADAVIDWDYQPWTGDRILQNARWETPSTKRTCTCGWSATPRITPRTLGKVIEALNRMTTEIHALAQHAAADLSSELIDISMFSPAAERLDPGTLLDVYKQTEDEGKRSYKALLETRREYLKASRGKAAAFRGVEEVMVPPSRHATQTPTEI